MDKPDPQASSQHIDQVTNSAVSNAGDASVYNIAGDQRIYQIAPFKP